MSGRVTLYLQNSDDLNYAPLPVKVQESQTFGHLQNKLHAKKVFDKNDYYFAKDNKIIDPRKTVGELQCHDGDVIYIHHKQPVDVSLSYSTDSLSEELHFSNDTFIYQIQNQIAEDVQCDPADIHLQLGHQDCTPDQSLGELGLTSSAPVTFTVNPQLSLVITYLGNQMTINISPERTVADIIDHYSNMFSLLSENVKLYKGPIELYPRSAPISYFNLVSRDVLSLIPAVDGGLQ